MGVVLPVKCGFLSALLGSLSALPLSYHQVLVLVCLLMVLWEEAILTLVLFSSGTGAGSGTGSGGGGVVGVRGLLALPLRSYYYRSCATVLLALVL